jgi:hypothetical protein
MMKLFEGGENPSVKGEFNPNGGEMFVALTKNIKDNISLFSFFRVLSKQWHYVSMARKEDRLNKKADQIRKDINTRTIEMDAHKGK